jgi:hypothetical protein
LILLEPLDTFSLLRDLLFPGPLVLDRFYSLEILWIKVRRWAKKTHMRQTNPYFPGGREAFCQQYEQKVEKVSKLGDSDD